ncbi:hypothetical protein K7432_006017 [Basidiobolus ranarum]|uniref:SLH domain-containing protein n=1 Tax=Basidiobolus ranarum TaxID=34480 RepID=A0ABR2W2D3_9FUNG
MKEIIYYTSFAALLLSTSFITTCTASKGPEISADKVSLGGPRDAKEVEEFADTIFASTMKKFNVVGSNFVVVRDENVMLSKGYGYADKERKIPVDKNTVFQIASVTKSFTALAVMQLVDRGKINLHRDIQTYLGGLKVPNKTGKPLTMYDLLTYTSGVDSPDIVSEFSPDYINQYIPLKEFLTTHMPTVIRPPGEAYTYDNFGFMLAGYAIEKVSGIPYSQYMEKHIFKPLGMNVTNVKFTPELLANMAAHYGPNGEFQEAVGLAPSESPQGSMLSTGEDMAKYLIMHLNKGEYGGKRIVSQKSIRQMHTYQIFADPTIPITTVGFEGYFKELMNDQHVILKGGNLPGHSSLVVILPEKNTAFYMSYSSDCMMSVDIYEAFMNHYYPKANKALPSVYMPLNEQSAQDYLGIYQNTRMHALRTLISYQNGTLLMESGTTGKHTLQMKHPLLFEDELGSKVAFKRDSTGNITYMYNTNPKGLDLVAYAQKFNMKTPFSDVPNDSKYKPYIDHLNALNIMRGKSDNLFNPNGTMTQEEFMEVLLRAHGWENIAYAAKKNRKLMLVGVPDYQPTAPITRKMAAVMIQNLKNPATESQVRLASQTDTWAAEAIAALVSQGIVDPDTKISPNRTVDFRPEQNLSRQEASALLDIAFGYYALPIQH